MAARLTARHRPGAAPYERADVVSGRAARAPGRQDMAGSTGRTRLTRYDEFLAQVRDRGEYADQDEAAKVTEAVLEALAGRITSAETKDLAAQLPAPLDAK
ncbi:DUF2267 domain-containing protein [Streptomyces bullii]|uniref:DUF2267 domain-containing protein n=1 Tax=Streptomyces bullii TaxID=349910 RepID=A0ABW0UV88_9ACTN